MKASISNLRRAHFPDNSSVSVTALDMVTHQQVGGVTIKLSNGVDDRAEDQQKVTSISKLQFKIEINGVYTITASKDGYTAAPVTFSVNCNKKICNELPDNFVLYMLPKLATGDFRVSLTYQEDTDYFLDMFQVNKLNHLQTCDALKSYNFDTKQLDCLATDLEWTSSPSKPGEGNGNGDSHIKECNF